MFDSTLEPNEDEELDKSKIGGQEVKLGRMSSKQTNNSQVHKSSNLYEEIDQSQFYEKDQEEDDDDENLMEGTNYEKAGFLKNYQESTAKDFMD